MLWQNVEESNTFIMKNFKHFMTDFDILQAINEDFTGKYTALPRI